MLVIKITPRKIFLIFLFTRYETTIIQLLFLEIFLVSLLLQAIIEVSQSNIFFIFIFYTCSSKFNSIFIIIRVCIFCSISSILIDSFSSSSFSSNLLLYIWLKFWQLVFQLPKFYGIYLHCVFWLHYYRTRQFWYDFHHLN